MNFNSLTKEQKYYLYWGFVLILIIIILILGVARFEGRNRYFNQEKAMYERKFDGERKRQGMQWQGCNNEDCFLNERQREGFQRNEKINLSQAKIISQADAEKVVSKSYPQAKISESYIGNESGKIVYTFILDTKEQVKVDAGTWKIITDNQTNPWNNISIWNWKGTTWNWKGTTIKE